jgi:hypothetical protein
MTMNNVINVSTRLDRIRELNDSFRSTFIGGRFMTTAAVAELPIEQKVKVLNAVRDFDAFTPDNDPHGEHDMAFFEIDGERYFWKFDYYAPDLESGAEDPADQEKTVRVLTIGLASDY